MASLDQTLPGNVTVEMSHNLYRVSEQVDASKYENADDFLTHVLKRVNFLMISTIYFLNISGFMGTDPTMS